MKLLLFAALGLPIVLGLTPLIESAAKAHSGRTDSAGCHYNRSTGIYHCH